MNEGKNLVGVDIGSNSIKVCELRESKSGPRTLVRYGYHPLPPRTIVDGHIANVGPVLEGLEKLFHKAKNRDVAIRFGGTPIIKKIVVPLMNPAELREQIRWEAEQHIPFDLAEVEMDWQVLARHEEHGQMDVLLVAAKKDEVAELVQTAVNARLKPRIIDLDAFALQNAFEIGYGTLQLGQTAALVHVGAARTTLNILSNATSGFTRDIASGGNQATDELSRALGVAPDEAERIKENPQPPKEATEILAQVAESLAGEVQRSLDFYLATSGDPEVQRIYLSGGSANLRALATSIERRARVPVELFDVSRVVVVDPKLADGALFASRALQSTIALGLALRKDKERTQA